jgi:hypothetical protein
MKTLNFGNLTIVISLIISLLLGRIISNCYSIAFVLGLFVMPAYQLVVGFLWLADSKGNKKIRYYFIGVLSYFSLIFLIASLNDYLKNQEFIENILSIVGKSMPILLSLYFTYILNQDSKDKN